MKTLVIIPTPIGNLSDISDNVKQALSDVDVLLCESILAPKKLYHHLGLKLPKLIRYWQKTEASVIANLDKLEGKVGLISDAGMPCISDPGYSLVTKWHDSGWPVSVIAGPSALTASLALSGIPSEVFRFEGFLVGGGEKRLERLQDIRSSGMSAVIYESPRRILDLCEEILKVYGKDHLVCVMKELTKKNETYYRSSISEVIEKLKKSDLRGEFVVVIDRAKIEPDWQGHANILKQYLSIGDVSSAVSKMHGISRSKVYQFLLEK